MLDYQDLPVLPPIRQPCRSHGTSHGYLAAFWATPRHRHEVFDEFFPDVRPPRCVSKLGVDRPGILVSIAMIAVVG